MPGRLKAVRAIGWYIDQYRQAQVSINLINYKVTPLHVVFETVREEAEKRGLIVTGSELVGLMPLQPLLEAGRFYLRKQGKSAGAPERELVEVAIRSLGLDQLGAVRSGEEDRRVPVPAAGTARRRWPSTGSSTRCRPTRRRPAADRWRRSRAASRPACRRWWRTSRSARRATSRTWQDLSDLAERAQAVKDRLVRAVDEDTEAFNGVMAAMRMPKGTPEQQAARDQALEAGYQAGGARPARRRPGACLDAMRLVADRRAEGQRQLRVGRGRGRADGARRRRRRRAQRPDQPRVGEGRRASGRQCLTSTEDLVLEATQSVRAGRRASQGNVQEGVRHTAFGLQAYGSASGFEAWG